MSNTEKNQQEQQQPQANQTRSYNPFMDVVNQQPYTTMSVSANPSQVTAPIPEPSYQPNTVRANENPYKYAKRRYGWRNGRSSIFCTSPN